MVPTIRDVASKAQVSFQLAAAVLGRKKYARASERTKEKIFSAAESLGYVPNASAQLLRGGASNIIGVIIDSRAPESMVGVLAEIEQVADRMGYRILSVQAHDNPEKFLHLYRSLKQNGVDGIISFSHDYSHLNRHLETMLQDDPKIVFAFNSPQRKCSAVDAGIAEGVQAAVEHLRSNGCRKTALLLGGTAYDQLSRSCKQRYESFLEACPDGEIFLLNLKPLTPAQWEPVFRRLIREFLVPEKFDSAIVQNDYLATVLMKQLQTAGIRIPQDFCLVGWDDRLICRCLPISLTSLHFDSRKVAETLLKILLDKIAGDPEPVRVTLPLKLVIRESSDRRHACGKKKKASDRDIDPALLEIVRTKCRKTGAGPAGKRSAVRTAPGSGRAGMKKRQGTSK
jgi:DNA-binding LacI/PurR family transcriptional regulator